MTTPNNLPMQTVPTPGSLSLWQILAESFRLYGRHWLPFTRVLITPMACMMVGLYSCLILSHRVIHFISFNAPEFAQEQAGLFLLIVLVITLGPLFLFCVGAWRYMVYFGSLNINALEVLEDHLPNFQAAYQSIAKHKALPYKGLLSLTYGLLPLVATGTLLLCSIIGGFYAASGNSMAFLALQVVGLLLSGIILLLWLILLIPLSFVTQIAVFDGNDLNPLRIFKQSCKLVFRRFGAALGLQVILFLATNYLLPMPIVFIFRQFSLTQPLDGLHLWVLQVLQECMMLDPASGTLIDSQAFSPFQRLIPHIVQGWTDLTIMLVVTALLLPLGTFAFTLLYRDITRQHPDAHKP